MRSLRSVVGALRKDHTCESALVGRVVVGCHTRGSSVGGVGDGVGAIDIGLALGLKHRTKERDVVSRGLPILPSG